MVEWLTEQIREDSIDNAVSDNISCLQREHVLQQVRRHVLGALALQPRWMGMSTQINLMGLDCQGHF